MTHQEGAIHTIPAPNLSINEGHHIPDLTIQNVNNHLDKDFPKFNSNGLPAERPVGAVNVNDHEQRQRLNNCAISYDATV